MKPLLACLALFCALSLPPALAQESATENKGLTPGEVDNQAQLAAKVVGLPGATLLTRPVEKITASDAPAAFDLVFADPPYKLETAELQDVLTGLAAHGWLADDAVVVVERGKREPWEWPERFAALRDRKYGEARLWYGHRHG